MQDYLSDCRFVTNELGISVIPNSFDYDQSSNIDEVFQGPISLLERTVAEPSKFSDMLYNTYYYQLRPGKLVKYSSPEFISHKRNECIDMLNNSHNETYKGEISPTAQKRIKRKMEVWYSAVVHHNSIRENVLQHNLKKLVFLTTTLQSNQVHSDQEIKEKILKPFLRILKKEYGCFNYLWKAESQANLRIHFHIIIDKYVPKEAIQSIWNKCSNALGYVDRFYDKFHHMNPPSTQIEVVENFGKALDYIDKYICKSEKYRSIDGAIWKASKSVQSLEYFEFVADNQVDLILDNAINHEGMKFFAGERYQIFYTKGFKISDLITPLNYKSYMLYQSYLDSYLFEEQRKIDFRSYCFKLAHKDEPISESIPFISKLIYPAPIQLSINEFNSTILRSENRSKHEKPNIYAGPLIVSSTS